MGGMVPQSQIRRTPGGAASVERIVEILPTGESTSRGAPGRPICEEFGVADARGRWQLAGCLKAPGVLAGRSDRNVLPPPQRPPIPSAPRRRPGHDAQRQGTRHGPQIPRPRENQGRRVVDGIRSRPRPVPHSLRLGCHARSRARSCPSGTGRQTAVHDRRARSVHGGGTAWNTKGVASSAAEGAEVRMVPCSPADGERHHNKDRPLRAARSWVRPRTRIRERERLEGVRIHDLRYTPTPAVNCWSARGCP